MSKKPKALKPVHCEPLHAYHKAARGLRDGRRYWQIMYHEGGQSLSVPGASGWYTRAEVSREMGRRVAEGTYGQQIPDGTMAGLLDGWLGHCAKVGDNTNTMRNQLNSADRLTAVMGTVRVDRVTDSLLVDIKRQLEARYSDATVNVTFAHLGAAWKWGRANGMTPDVALQLPRRRVGKKVRKVYNDYMPTSDEVRAVLLYMPDDWRRPMVELLWATGARYSDVVKLGWDAFELGERPVMTVCAESKTGRRGVPLNGSVVTMLRALRESTKDSLYWHGKDRPNQNPLYEAIKRACNRAGVPQWSPKALRHLAVTEMLLAGVPIHVVCSITGHSESVALKYYAKVRAENADDAVAVLGRGSEKQGEEMGQVIPIRRHGKG